MSFISYGKISKKGKKKINTIKRKEWGELNPVTRFIESKKLYKRKQNYGSGNLVDE